jgi:hypothetical protein
MTSNTTNIPAPRVPFIDERTGLISREWFRYLNNVFVLTGSGTTQITTADLELAPALAATMEDTVPVLESEIQALKIAPPPPQVVAANYGMFYDTTTQTAAAINTAYPITFNTTAYGRGVRRGSTTSQIFCNDPGLYNFAFSVQFDKTSGGDALAYVWGRKNGTDIADSTSHIRVKGNDAEILCTVNFFVEMSNGDYFQLMWATADTSVQVQYFAATAFAPATPSVILTVNQVNL